MRIIFKNIPTDTSPNQLVKYIQPSLGNGVFSLFKPSGKISKINILAQKDHDSNVVKYHGLVTIEPDKAAIRTIKRLNKTSFNGKIVFIKEFINRTVRKDRRKNLVTEMEPPHNRRSTERRRHILEEITHFGISFSDRPQFSRKLGG